MAQRLLPPLRLLTVFDTVLRSGSVKTAASELNVTQPAISQALKALEDHIGTPLLDRTTRPASLTEGGRILQRGVTNGLAQIAAAVSEVRSLHTSSALSLTVACTVGTATYWLMPRLPEFYAGHPDIAVNVMTTAGVPELLPGVDLLIRYGAGNWKDGRAVRLFTEKVTPVCSPEVIDRIKTLGGLQNATLLHVRSDDATWLTWKDFFERNGLPANKVTGRFFTNYIQATQAALSGQGVMLGWESNTGDLVRDGRLVALDYPPIVPSEAFYLVVPDSKPPTPAIKAFTDWIDRATRQI